MVNVGIAQVQMFHYLGKSYPAGQAVPSNVMATAEAYFLRAEGAMLGWNMGGGTAKEYYEKGITESLKQWGSY